MIDEAGEKVKSESVEDPTADKGQRQRERDIDEWIDPPEPNSRYIKGSDMLATDHRPEDFTGCARCGQTSCYHCAECLELCWEHKPGCKAANGPQTSTRLGEAWRDAKGRVDVYTSEASGTRACLLCQELITAEQGRSLTVSREPGDSMLIFHMECAAKLAEVLGYRAVPVQLLPPLDAGSLTFAEIEVACANMGINLECGGCASEFYTGHTEPHDETCTRESGMLTRDELSSLQTIAVAASPDVSRCLEIIERLTGQKIVPADERADVGDAVFYKCYYCGLPKSEHSVGTTGLNNYACHGLAKFFYPIRRECRLHPEIAAELLAARKQAE